MPRAVCFAWARSILHTAVWWAAKTKNETRTPLRPCRVRSSPENGPPSVGDEMCCCCCCILPGGLVLRERGPSTSLRSPEIATETMMVDTFSVTGRLRAAAQARAPSAVRVFVSVQEYRRALCRTTPSCLGSRDANQCVLTFFPPSKVSANRNFSLSEVSVESGARREAPFSFCLGARAGTGPSSDSRNLVSSTNKKYDSSQLHTQ